MRFCIPGYFNWRKFTWVPRHSIEYQCFGPEGGQFVVCAHAATRNLHDFDYLAKFLAANYRVLLFDFPGRGESDWFKNSKHYDYYVYVKDSIHLLNHLCERPVHWIGTSMGGIVGMVVAALFPEKICSLILNDIGAEIPFRSSERIKRYLDLDPTFASFEEVVAYCKMAYAKFGIREDEHWTHVAKSTVRLQKDGTYKLKFDPRIGMDNKNSKGREISLWKWWKKVSCSTLIISGSESDILLPSTIEKMKNDRNNVSHYQILGAGHAPALFEQQHLARISNWIDKRSKQS